MCFSRDGKLLPPFVHNFASIVIPLTDSTLKKAPDKIGWSSVMSDAFSAIKEALMSHQVLASPDPTELLILQTDVSGIGTGAVPSQEQDGVEHPVAYFPRKLLPRETRYTVTEQECLAVVESVTCISRG